MGSSQQPVTQQTTQTKDPWGPAQPFLREAMENAQGFFQSGTGYQPYTGPTQAPLAPGLDLGINTGQNLALSQLGGAPGVLAGMNLGTNVINQQGITPGIQAAAGGLGQAAGQYGDIYSQASGQQNPYLQSILDTSNRRIGDRINAAMSGAGRYGSGQHTDVMARALAESADPILAQDYQARQQQRLAATQGFGATQQSLADLYGQGLQRSGQWAQLAPSLAEAQYAPAQKLAGYGEYLTQRDQQALADQMKMYNAQQAWPWEQLARYNAIIGGAGGLGGTAVTTAPGPQQPSLLQSGLGGALAGAGLGSTFGPAGAGAGALGGGLLGLLR
jgi:hypothetical protein